MIIREQMSPARREFLVRAAMVGIGLPLAGISVGGAHVHIASGSDFNVKDFGAVGDGATDDTVAIQAACTAAAASPTGAIVEVPPGIYIINTIRLPQNIHFRLAGMATFRHKTNAAGDMFVSDIANLIGSIIGGKIDGNRASQNGRFAIFNLISASVADYTWHDVKFTGTVLAPITITYATDGVSRVLDCTMLDMANHGPNTGDNSYAGRFFGRGLAFVRGCYVEAAAPVNPGQAAGGFLFDGGCRVICDDCEFNRVGQSYVGNYVGCVVLYNGCDDAVISNIRCRNIYFAGLVLQNAGKLAVNNIVIDGDSGSLVGYGVDVDPATRTPSAVKKNITLDNIVIAMPNTPIALRVHTQSSFLSRNVMINNLQVQGGHQGVFVDYQDGQFELRGFDIANSIAGTATGYGIEIQNCTGSIRLIDGVIRSCASNGITTGNGTNLGLDLEIASVYLKDVSGVGIYMNNLASLRIHDCLSRGANVRAIQVVGRIATAMLTNNIVDAGQTALIDGRDITVLHQHGNSFDPPGSLGVTGDIAAGGEFRINSQRVLKQRRPGWSSWTGIPDRSAHGTYNGDSAGVAYERDKIQRLMTAVQNLSQSHKALLDDLNGDTGGMGIIGA